MRLLRAALPHLRLGDDPAILVVLSSSVREPIPALITSNVLRPFLDGKRAEAAGVSREEIAQRQTAAIPLGRYGHTSEIGRIGAFLLSPAASYVTGAIVPVDGGMIKALP